jgi:hypothetical protein
MTPPDFERNKKLITPLLRCASPEQLRFTAKFLRRHSKTKRGAIGSPFCIFGLSENYRIVLGILRIIITELDGCCDDAKLADGGAGSSPNAGDDAGHATTPDSSPVARQDALSSRQG